VLGLRRAELDDHDPPAGRPGESTMSRRRNRADTAMLMRAVVARIRQEGDPALIARIDGQPLPIGGSGHDP
jgi:hypothetical protein